MSKTSKAKRQASAEQREKIMLALLQNGGIPVAVAIVGTAAYATHEGKQTIRAIKDGIVRGVEDSIAKYKALVPEKPVLPAEATGENLPAETVSTSTVNLKTQLEKRFRDAAKIEGVDRYRVQYDNLSLPGQRYSLGSDAIGIETIIQALQNGTRTVDSIEPWQAEVAFRYLDGKVPTAMQHVAMLKDTSPSIPSLPVPPVPTVEVPSSPQPEAPTPAPEASTLPETPTPEDVRQLIDRSLSWWDRHESDVFGSPAYAGQGVAWLIKQINPTFWQALILQEIGAMEAAFVAEMFNAPPEAQRLIRIRNTYMTKIVYAFTQGDIEEARRLRRQAQEEGVWKPSTVLTSIVRPSLPEGKTYVPLGPVLVPIDRPQEDGRYQYG